MADQQCEPWCLECHDDGEPCENDTFTVPTTNLVYGEPVKVQLSLRQGEAGPLLSIEAPWMPEPLEMNREQAVDFCQDVMELTCLIGACNCGHGPLCVRPDCPGDCGYTHE